MRCFVDTSAFYAYLVAGDRYHEAVAKYLTEAVEAGKVLFSSSLVLGKTLGLLQTRHGVDAAARFMTTIYPLIAWRWIDQDLFPEIWRLVQAVGARSFTAVDASAVVCIAEHPGSVCVAVDDDLRAFGFEVFPK